jgi:hypothetical protein
MRESLPGFGIHTIRVICLIKSDRGFRPSKVLWGCRTHSIDHPARKLELTPRLMGNGPAVDRHHYLFPGEGCGALSPQVSFRLLSLGESPPRSCSFFYHGALFELVLDGLCMVWIGRFERFLERITQLLRLVLELAP